MEKSLTKKLLEAKKRISYLEKILRETEVDRAAFRNKIVSMLKNEIQHVGNKTYLEPKDRVEDLAKFMCARERWYW